MKKSIAAKKEQKLKGLKRTRKQKRSHRKILWLEAKIIQGGDHMTKKKPKHNNSLPKADIEFAEERGNGFEKVALKAQRKHNK